jgi:Phage tail lysozyme
MKLPEQIQFNPQAESIGFRPITPASSTKAAAENAERLNNSLERNGELARANSLVKVREAGQNAIALAEFSKTLSGYLTDLHKKTEEDKITGAQYDYLMQGFDESIPANSTPEQRRVQSAEHDVEQAANVGGDQAARFSYEIEQSTGNPVMGNMAWQRTGGLARGFRAEEAVLMQARSSYNGFLAAYLQSGATIQINGQEVSVSEAVNSGDPALTNAAITAARFQFIRQNGLHLATKDAFIKHFAPTMLATEGAISGQLVLGAIKGQREARQQELEGLGYDLAQNTQTGEVGTTFESLSRQFFQGGLGISRGQANALAVKSMISAFEDQGNVEALQALLDVQQKPGQAGTELRRLFGNDINDAIRRAEGRQDEIQQRDLKDVEAAMYEQLAGATTQQQRDQIIEQAAQQLEAKGRYREARQLRQERDELSVSGSNELNAARLEEGLRTGTATPEQVRQARLRGDITAQQEAQLLRDSGNDAGSKETEADLKNPLLKGVADSYGDRAETEFLGLVGLNKDVYGRILPGGDSMITAGQAEIIRQQMRTDIQRVTQQALAVSVGLTDQAKQQALHQALKEWYKTEVTTKGGKYFVPPRVEITGKPAQWDPKTKQYLANLANSPGVLSRGFNPSSTRAQDFSTRVTGTTVSSDVVRQFRRVRNDKLFSQDTVENLLYFYQERGEFQRGLQKAAQQLGMSPLALLTQQALAHGLEAPTGRAQLESNSPGVAPTSGVSGAQRLMSMGFPARGAAWLAGNIQQESGWNGQRNPWDDGGELSGGLVSWRADRLDAVQNSLGSITRASNEAQLRYMVQELRDKYPSAYRIFMNPRATDRQLIQASKAFWGYGEEGDRYGYARQIEADLSNRNRSTPGRTTGGGSQRAVQVGRQLLSQGVRVWQNPAFDLDRGHVGSGGRVGTHAETSFHYSGQALDIPRSHNDEASLRRTFNYLRQNMRRLGIAELFWNPMGFYRDGRSIGGAGSNAIPNHDSHIHVAFS